jgi:hypothetical protein
MKNGSLTTTGVIYVTPVLTKTCNGPPIYGTLVL